MTNLEWLKKNLTQETKESCSFCRGVYKMVNGKSCDDENNYIKCENCKFCKIEDFINFLSQEHKEQIKLKKWEYDLIEHYAVIKRFDGVDMLIVMRSKGHFKGVKDTSMSIQYILNNCEVIE